jgi:predicted nucleic acid-binding protein
VIRTVFVDTSAWYAIADRGDERHDEAAQTLDRLLRERFTLLTTNHVVGESYTLLRIRLGARAAQEFLRRTRISLSTRRVFVPEAWEEVAEELLIQYADHAFSYVDATSFVTMRRLDLREAFAFDRHFVAAGFALLSEKE